MGHTSSLTSTQSYAIMQTSYSVLHIILQFHDVLSPNFSLHFASCLPQTVSMSVSVLTLTTVAWDRYYAICKPLSVLSYKKERVIIKLIIIWSLSIIISLPETMMLSAVSFLNNRLHFPCAEEDIFWDLSSCDPSWSNSTVFLITSLKTVMLFIVPLVIMVIIYRQIFKTLWSRKMTGPQSLSSHVPDVCNASLCQTRQASSLEIRLSAQMDKRKKTAMMLVALVVVFFITNLPVHMFNLLIHLNEDIIPPSHRPLVGQIVAHGQLVGHTMCYINSALSPAIYIHMSQAFRTQFRVLLSSKCCCGQRT